MKSDTVVGRQLSLLGGLDFLKKIDLFTKTMFEPLGIWGGNKYF